MALAGMLPAATSHAASPCGDTVIVVYGDTLTEIAERCETSVDSLLAANPQIEDTRALPIGMELDIPTSEQPAQRTYVVERGDTLFGLASRFDTTIAALMEANPEITNPALIYVGQHLTIPTEQDRPGQPVVTVGPDAGRVGDTVLVEADNFPANTPVVVGFGRPNSEYDVILEGRTSPTGSFARTVEVPAFAGPADEWVFVVATADRQTTAAAAFDVLAERETEASVQISPERGPVGTTVQVDAAGFPANAEVIVGVGRAQSEPATRTRMQTDANGDLNTEVTIPQSAEAGEPWVVVVTAPNQRVDALSNRFTVTEGEQTGRFTRTNIYLIAIEDNGQRGKAIGCNDSVVPVDVQIEPTVAPMRAAFEELLSLDSRNYGQSGLYNALHASDLSVESVDIDNREAQIHLSGTLMQGGTCDTPRIEAQLQETALHYSTVDSVSITINGEPLESVLSLR